MNPATAARLATAFACLALVAATADAQARGGQRVPPRMTQGEAADVEGTSAIRGQIVAADTGAPIRRAQVRAASPDARASRVTITDAEGRFEIANLPAGRYTVTASKGGFVTLQYGQRRPGESGNQLDLGDGEVLDKVVLPLPRGSVIAGRIFDEYGDPVAGADVRAMQYRYLAGARRLVPGTGNSRGRTDDQGSFRLYGLTPGEYTVSATLREGQGAASVNLEAEEPSGYAPTYHPGVPNLAEAQRITLGVGQEQTNISFGLLLTRLVRVSGRVIDSTGMPATRGAVMLLPADTLRSGMSGMNAGGAAVRGDGTFQFPGVAPGNYILFVRPGGGGGRGFGGGGAGEFARLPLTVGTDDVRDVFVATAPGAIARGVVTTDGGQPLPGQARQIGIAAIGADPENSLGTAQARVAEDGTFELRGLSDARLIRVNTPAGWHLKSVLFDGTDVTDTPIDFALGSTTTGLRVVLTESVTELLGTVVDDRGDPVLDAAVVVFAADESAWTFQSRFIQAARPDQDGRYRIRGLPPHTDYRIAAVQGLEDGQAGDPDFLRAVAQAAARLSLNEGEVKTVDVRVR